MSHAPAADDAGIAASLCTGHTTRSGRTILTGPIYIPKRPVPALLAPSGISLAKMQDTEGTEVEVIQTSAGCFMIVTRANGSVSMRGITEDEYQRIEQSAEPAD